MKHKSVFLLLLLGCLLLTGCDSKDSNDALRLIPIEVGNRWEGATEDNDFRMSMRVEGTEAINGVSYAVIQMMINDEIPTFYEGGRLYTRQNEGGVYIGERLRNGDLLGFLLRYPIEDNTSYIHIDEEGNEFTVQVSKLSASVPAGTFDVIQYRISDGAHNNTTALIAPGIGPVVVYGFQLTSYDVQ